MKSHLEGSKMMKSHWLRRLVGATAALAMVWVSPAHATVDEAHDFAMEAAIPFVEQGFIVREDYWNGEVQSGQKLMITHQLFKGNEYAFWLGTANEGATLDLRVFDEKNQPVQIKATSDKFFMSVRVNPPKTGTYRIVFELKSRKEPALLWALAYGYR